MSEGRLATARALLVVLSALAPNACAPKRLPEITPPPSPSVRAPECTPRVRLPSRTVCFDKLDPPPEPKCDGPLARSFGGRLIGASNRTVIFEHTGSRVFYGDLATGDCSSREVLPGGDHYSYKPENAVVGVQSGDRYKVFSTTDMFGGELAQPIATFDPAAHVEFLTATPDYVLARLRDGTLIYHDRASGRQTRTLVKLPPFVYGNRYLYESPASFFAVSGVTLISVASLEYGKNIFLGDYYHGAIVVMRAQEPAEVNQYERFQFRSGRCMHMSARYTGLHGSIGAVYRTCVDMPPFEVFRATLTDVHPVLRVVDDRPVDIVADDGELIVFADTSWYRVIVGEVYRYTYEWRCVCGKRLAHVARRYVYDGLAYAQQSTE